MLCPKPCIPFTHTVLVPSLLCLFLTLDSWFLGSLNLLCLDRFWMCAPVPLSVPFPSFLCSLRRTSSRLLLLLSYPLPAILSHPPMNNHLVTTYASNYRLYTPRMPLSFVKQENTFECLKHRKMICLLRGTLRAWLFTRNRMNMWRLALAYRPSGLCGGGYINTMTCIDHPYTFFGEKRRKDKNTRMIVNNIRQNAHTRMRHDSFCWFFFHSDHSLLCALSRLMFFCIIVQESHSSSTNNTPCNRLSYADSTWYSSYV